MGRGFGQPDSVQKVFAAEQLGLLLCFGEGIQISVTICMIPNRPPVKIQFL